MGPEAARVSPGSAGTGASVSRSQQRGRQSQGRPMGTGPHGPLWDESVGDAPSGTGPQSDRTPEKPVPVPERLVRCVGPGTRTVRLAAQGPWEGERPAEDGEKPHGCADCGRSFRTKQTFLSHQRVHTGEKPFACLQCGRSFTRKENLVRHQETHMDKEPHTCAECGKSFLHEGSLLLHRRAHAGARPFSCTHCGKSFNWKTNLTAHLRSHGEQRSVCRECGRTFGDRGDLQRHEQTHAGSGLLTGYGNGETFSEFLQIHEMLISRTHAHKPLGALTKYK
uniref:C2H2-type domain-containing protein n=1 Tax=Pelusios castaneus TaxID=367368 RepID=A0A8C8VNC7_9SAUR